MKIKNIFLILLIFIIFSSLMIWQEDVKLKNDVNSIDNRNNILFVGDIMITRNVEDDPFKYVSNLISSSTIASGNLEFAITDNVISNEKE